MFCNGVGDFVALENVLQGSDRESESLCSADHREDFILSVTMAMHEARAFQNFHKRLQFEVRARWHGARARFKVKCFVARVCCAVLLRGEELVFHECHNTHAA